MTKAQDKVAPNKETLVKRLRYTASRGVSVWGDLMLEAADALEQPAQEPVALECTYGYSQCQALAVAQQKRPWVGLTNDEVNEFAEGCHLGNSVQGAIYKAEAKLKDKNT